MAYTNSPLVSYIRISPNRTQNRTHTIDTITIHCVVGQCSVETLGQIFASPSKQASSNYGIGPDGRVGMYVEEKDRSWCSSSPTNDHRAITIEVASDVTEPYAVRTAAYEGLIRLVVDVCKRNGIKKLVWSTDKNTRMNHLGGANMTIHRDYANKSCPGTYLYSRMGDIAARVNAQLGVVGPAPTPTPTPTPAQPLTGTPIEKFQKACNNDGIVMPVDGIFGAKCTAAAQKILSNGSTGSRVTLVQQICMDAKIGLASGADGVYGAATKAAVMEFQKQKGLTIDGKVGLATWKALLGIGIAAPTPAQTNSLVKQFQEACIADRLAFSIYEVDGIWGPKTEACAKKTLSRGASGARVKLVQKICMEHKIGVTGGADGVFGQGTWAAVREFQKQNKLAIDGVVGVSTWKKLLGV